MRNFKNIQLGKLVMVTAMALAATACQQDDIIEQYNPSMDKTPLECAETSINYLKSL